jgi:hypothetical protein
MTIFKLQNGKVVPIAIVKNGQTSPFNAQAPGAAPPAAPSGATPPAAPSPNEPAKPAEPKKEESKK